MTPSARLGFEFDNTYANQLPGFYVAGTPDRAPQPALALLNHGLALELGLDPLALAGADGLEVLAGNTLPAGAQPIAQAYAGHQFGGFSPQLGDGRALLLGEVIDRHGRRRDLAYKGSGRTPFSRGGDGKAALGPMLREYLIGEAMTGLGIPSTRALSVVTTGEPVYRDYPLPGALLIRVASSHLRVGTFQYFAARRQTDELRRLADYAIARHDPELVGRDDRYAEWLRAVVARQAGLIASWMGVGFIHGVMNTDNMTISGETIDYGPCAFVEAYDPATVFSSIDQQGRYAFGNQPAIAQWNLARLAESVLPLLDESSERAIEVATRIIGEFATGYDAAWAGRLRAKLGLGSTVADADVTALGEGFLALLQAHQVDFTLAFRRLVDAAAGDAGPLFALFGEAVPQARSWLEQWQAHAGSFDGSAEARLQTLSRANPVYIARNHLVEAALSAAVERNDLEPCRRLLGVLEQPFDEREADREFARPGPLELTQNYRTFCGT